MTITSADVPQVEKKTLPKEELENINAYRLPDYVPPYHYKRNSWADKAKASAYRWVEEFSLEEVYKTPEELKGLHKADFAELAVGGYVDCGEKELTWAAKFYTWLFIFDDRMDDSAYFCAPEKSTEFFLHLNLVFMWSFPDDEEFYDKFVRSLEDANVPNRTEVLNRLRLKLDEARQKPGSVYDTSSPQVDALGKSLGDLWTELAESVPREFLRRWTLLFQTELLENLRETSHRKTNTVPTVKDYIAWRRHSVGVFVVVVLTEFTDTAYLPDKVFDGPEMQRFLVALGDICGWHNDLWSFRKEALKGDVHNLVIVLSHEEGVSYAEAGNKVYQMLLDKLVEMEQAIDDLKNATPPEYLHAVSRYAHWGRQFIAGAHKWHDNCARYIKS